MTKVVEWNDIDLVPRERLYAKAYFNGGEEYGGYAREGYSDFPVHWLTYKHVMDRKPTSVLEVGAARGYLVKRFQDQGGIPAHGIEISKHCYLTRATDAITQFDICTTPWPFQDKEFDLCLSVATMEHIPEQYLPNVIHEMARVSQRGLHGIDFGEHDDGWDKTHCSLHPKSWWDARFGNPSIEVVDKEALERGDFPEEYLKDPNGLVKLNIGSFTCMHHQGWINIDIHTLENWAAGNRYNFQKVDVRQTLPYGSGAVDLIFSSHMLEHLTYDEGLKFLKECRRVLKPTGGLRLVVPDARMLMSRYITHNDMSEFDEISEPAISPVARVWSLLHDNHLACYDEQTLMQQLTAAGFVGAKTPFHEAAFPATEKIVQETIDQFPCLSLIMDALPQNS